MQLALNARSSTRPRPLPQFLIANPRLEFSPNSRKQTRFGVPNWAKHLAQPQRSARFTPPKTSPVCLILRARFHRMAFCRNIQECSRRQEDWRRPSRDQVLQSARPRLRMVPEAQQLDGQRKMP